MKKHEKMSRVIAVTAAALIAAGELSGSGPLLLGGDEAHAVVGRPLTPMSYAGVARRTTRRAVYAGAYSGAYHHGAYYSGAYAAPYAAPTVVTVLPAGCVRGVTSTGTVVYTCGTARYAPYYDGPTVVYQPI